MEQGSPPDVSLILSSLSLTKYANVASATLLVYDIALTFEQEVQCVWKAKKTLGTTLFFLNRYIPLGLFAFDLYSQLVPSTPSREFCKNYQTLSSILDLVPLAIIESVLIIRTHALYQSRAILFSLSSLAVASLIHMLSCLLVLFRLETFIPSSAVGLPGCLPLSSCTSPLCRPLLIVFWVPFILLETSVCFLTVRKLYERTRARFPRTRSSIMGILLRDGLIYYVVILAIAVSNFIIWIVDPFATYLAVGFLKSLQSTICSRILLNLRSLLTVDNRRTNQSMSGP